MSTVTIPYDAPARRAASFHRFVWKEYRMLRGLWLAVLVVGALVQWALGELMPPTIDHAAMQFSTALAAAVLYAVGAAATTFSVEHEEETYGLLLALPTTWGPLFAGKLLVSALDAVLLATALTVTGWIISGFAPPGGRDPAIALGMFGMAVLEGLAWGTLFSLLVKRPLAAALWTIFVGTLAVNLAVNATSSFAVGSIVPQAYLEAVPLRLAFVAIVLAGSVAVAHRWLVVGAGPRGLAHFAQSAEQNVPVPLRPAQGRSLARLLWQSWRESWKLLVLPIIVASLLIVAIVLLVGFSGPGDSLPPSLSPPRWCRFRRCTAGWPFPPISAAVRHRFLAEHAARPRHVWLARHILWLGALLILFVAIVLIGSAVTTLLIRDSSSQFLKGLASWGGRYETLPGLAYDVATTSGFAARGIVLAWYGALAAYAFGQLCSMLLRSEILAAFLALVLDAVLVAWIAALFAWHLSGWLFLLPLAVGLMLATWLRAPDWIAGRNSWRAWLKPALAGVAPFILAALALPIARLSQLPPTVFDRAEKRGRWIGFQTAIDKYVAEDEHAATPEARETARLYMQAAEQLAAGPEEKYLARWESPGRSWIHGGFLEKSIPADELDAFHEAEEKQLEAIRASIVEAVDAAVAISRRPGGCRFDFELGSVLPLPTYEQKNWSLEAYPPYMKLVRLQWAVFQKGQSLRGNQFGTPRPTADDEFTEDFLERAVAALRISADLRSGQPSAVFMTQLVMENEILQWIGLWAARDGRTTEELRDALGRLSAQLVADQPQLGDTLVADHLLVRDVLQGREAPLALQSDSWKSALAYQAHQLPWERERSLRALDRITLYNLRDADDLADFSSAPSESEWGLDYLRRWLRPFDYWGDVAARWQIAEPAAATSYLTALEYEIRVPIHELYRAYCNNLACRRAAVLQLALAAYRRDHGSYPPQLADLVPDYLDQLPLDPYARQPFQYEPNGLDLPISGRVAPHIPFLWSVGAGNARLVRRYQTRYEDDDNDPGTENIEIKEPVYDFTSQERPWWNEPTLVFPLRRPAK